MIIRKLFSKTVVGVLTFALALGVVPAAIGGALRHMLSQQRLA